MKLKNSVTLHSFSGNCALKALALSFYYESAQEKSTEPQGQISLQGYTADARYLKQIVETVVWARWVTSKNIRDNFSRSF